MAVFSSGLLGGRKGRLLSLTFVSLLDPLIERLQHTSVYGGNHIHSGIQFFVAHARFPCVRKAPLNSRIAQPHHRNGKTDEHFFAVRQACDHVRIAVKGSKVSFLHRESASSIGGLAFNVSSNPEP